MASDTDLDELLRTLEKEGVKIKCLYDGSNRLEFRYEAVANAVDGAPCLKTQFTYVGATTDVDQMQESIDVWDETWDI